MGNYGKLEENKVKVYVKSIIDTSKYKFIDSDRKGPKIENMYDFMIKKGKKKFYFEIYSPAKDQEDIMNKIKNTGGSIITLDYLEFAIIKKYITQFKNNPPKYLIINLNNSEIANAFKVMTYTPLESIFSLKIYNSEANECVGLFHKIKYKYSRDEIFEDLEKNCSEIKLNNMKKLIAVIIFINNKFIQIIINPYSNNSEIAEIKEILNISAAKRSVINNPPINENEGLIKKVNDNIYKKLKKL